jgi:hypothetical protein
MHRSKNRRRSYQGTRCRGIERLVGHRLPGSGRIFAKSQTLLSVARLVQEWTYSIQALGFTAGVGDSLKSDGAIIGRTDPHLQPQG